jgi:hypothetical protein
MRLLALKIDVDTYRGTREGVPNLVDMLTRHGAGATFLFSLGPDHTGRAVRRALRPGFMKKVSRTSVLEHYGLKTLLYGTLLPGLISVANAHLYCGMSPLPVSRPVSTPMTMLNGRITLPGKLRPGRNAKWTRPIDATRRCSAQRQPPTALPAGK